MVGKTQIVDRVVARGAERAQAAAAVDAVLDEITTALAAGERVTLVGFGTFEPATRGARSARNPRTGAVVDVAATTVARFRPGTSLRAAVAGGTAPAPTAHAPAAPAPTAPAPVPVDEKRPKGKKPAVAPASGTKAPSKAPSKAETKAETKAATKAGSKPSSKAASKAAAKGLSKSKPSKTKPAKSKASAGKSHGQKTAKGKHGGKK
jgi:DNA-binding protein HU-beta